MLAVPAEKKKTVTEQIRLDGMQARSGLRLSASGPRFRQPTNESGLDEPEIDSWPAPVAALAFHFQMAPSEYTNKLEDRYAAREVAVKSD